MRILEPAEVECEEMEEGEEEMSGCMEYTTTDPCSFYVTRVPESVFSVDLEETLRVCACVRACVRVCVCV